jgi:hypothetical protein
MAAYGRDYSGAGDRNRAGGHTGYGEEYSYRGRGRGGYETTGMERPRSGRGFHTGSRGRGEEGLGGRVMRRGMRHTRGGNLGGGFGGGWRGEWRDDEPGRGMMRGGMGRSHGHTGNWGMGGFGSPSGGWGGERGAWGGERGGRGPARGYRSRGGMGTGRGGVGAWRAGRRDPGYDVDFRARGRYDRDFGDRLREGWHRLREGARDFFGGDPDYDRDWR